MSDTGPAAPLPPISLSAEHKEIKLPPIQLPPISSLASPGGSSINSHAGLHDKPTSATTSPQGQMIAPQVSPPRTSLAASASKTPSLSPPTKDSVATDSTLRSNESACPPSPRVSEPQPTPHQQQASSIPGASAAAAILAQNVVVSAATAFNTPSPSTQAVPSGSPCPNQPASPANANLPPPSSPMRLNRPPPGVPVPSEHILQRIAQQDSAHRAQQSSAAQQRLAPPPETTSNAQFAHPQGGVSVNVNGAPQQQQPPPGGLQQSQLTHQQQLALIARRRQHQQANMQQTQRQRKAAAGQAAQNRQGNTATAQQNRSSPFNQAPSPSNNLQGGPSGSPRPVLSGGRPPGVPSPASVTSEPPSHQQQVHMQQRTLPQGLHPQGTIPTAQHPLPVQLGRYPPPRPMPKGAAATSQAGHPTQLHQALSQPSRQFQVNRAPGQAVVGVPQTCGRAAGPVGGQHPVMQHQQMQGQGVGVAVAGPSSAVPLPRTQAAAALFNEEPKPGSAKEEYRMLKRKFKYLVYENECYQEQLRNLQRKLLKLSRDKNFLLDRLTSYEKLSESSDDDSDTSQRTLVDDRPKTKKKKANRKRPAAPPSGVAVAVSGASAAVASTSSATPLASTSTSAPGPSGLSSQPPPAKKSNANPGIHQMLAQHSQHMQQLQRQQMILQHQQRMQQQDQRVSQQAAGSGPSGQGMGAQEPNTMLRTRLPSHSGPRQPPILQQPSSSGMSVGGPPVNSGAEAPLNLHTSGNPSTMGSTQPQRLRNPSGPSPITSVAGHQQQPSSSGQQLPASSVQQAPAAPQRKQAGKPGHRRHPPLTAAAHRILQQRQQMQDQAQLQQQQQQRQQLLLQQQHAQQLQMNALGLRTVDEQRITVEQHLRQQASKGELVSKPKNNHIPFLTNGGGGVLRVEQPSVASRSGESAPVTQVVSASVTQPVSAPVTQLVSAPVTQPVSAPVTQPVSAVSLSDQIAGGQTIRAGMDAEPTSTPSTNLEQVGSQPADSTLRKHTEPGTVGALIDGSADRAQREGDSTVKREEQQQNSDVVAPPQRSISNGPTTIESPPSVSTEENQNQTRLNGEHDTVLVKEKNEEETEDIRTVKREHGDGEKQTLKKKKEEPLVNGSQDNGDVSIGGEAESL